MIEKGLITTAICFLALPSIALCQEKEAVRLAKPTREQVAWQDMEIEMFLCLDPCTWQDREFDDHSTPPGKINPTKLNTDQWVSVAESMGARQIIFVAKHVGGFCWWQTNTTDYGVRNIPWREGKGDVVADLAKSCRTRGMKLGIYLSPADSVFGAGVGGRCKTKEAQERYNEVYRRQLTELLTRYGEVSEVWFDGSLVVRVGDILKKHAPRAMVFQGPDATIRWVGNESGVAPYPAWNAVSEASARSGVATARHGAPNGTVWLPNECDARIRSTWFWNTKNAHTLKSVDQLMEMYYRSVGHGAVLLLNQTPDTTGLIPEANAARGAEFGAEIRRRFGKSIAETSGKGSVLELDLGRPTFIDHVATMEDIIHGERIREYVIEGLIDGRWQGLCKGTAVGHRKIDRFNGIEASKVRLRCTKSAATPTVRKLAVYDTNPEGKEIVEKLAKPTPEQAAWHDCEIGMFIHFAPQARPNKAAVDYSVPLDQINPSQLDTDQWVAAAEAMGAKYIVFVAKHADGFCFWQTDTTDHGIKSTPWRDGKGDVLADLAKSCRKRGMKLGVYLSPCDHKHGAGVGGRCKSAREQELYNKLYRQQLTEVLSRYGEMFEVWFDGGVVVEVGDILEKYAPRAMVFQGPHATIRWVGNENGIAPYPAWNAVSAADAKSGVATARHGDPDGTVWLPNECDARIRSAWLWNAKNAHTLKSVAQLMEMYYHSVGHGAVLLLNQTPDPTGRIPEADVKRGAEFGREIERRFGNSIAETKGRGYNVELALPDAATIDHVMTTEDITHGERVREYVIEGWIGDRWLTLCKGQAVGHKKIDRFTPIEVSKVRFRCINAAATPRIRRLAVFNTGGETPEPLSETPVVHYTLDAIEAGKVMDISGRQRHGVVKGAEIVQGLIGNALRFDGRNAYVNLGNFDVFLGDFSIAAWLNPRPGGRGARIITSKETCTVSPNQCRFYLAADNRLGFMMSDSFGAHIWPFESGGSTVPSDTWSHVAVTRRGTDFRLYLNGKMVGQKTSQTVIRHRNAVDVKIGCVFDPSGAETLEAFDGLIDALRIYNRPLSENELQRLADTEYEAQALAPHPIWKWTPEQVRKDWTTIEIDITPFCKDAAQYEVQFKKTGGQHDIEIKDITLLFDERETPELVERTERPNAFYITLPGVGVPLKLRATIRGKGGVDSHGQVFIRKTQE